MVRMGHPTHRRNNLKKNSSGAKILDCIKKGKVGFFSGSLGWPAKGNIFCKVWIGLLLPDQSYTSRMKGSGLYFSTNTWTFTISRTIFVWLWCPKSLPIVVLPTVEVQLSRITEQSYPGKNYRVLIYEDIYYIFLYKCLFFKTVQHCFGRYIKFQVLYVSAFHVSYSTNGVINHAWRITFRPKPGIFQVTKFPLHIQFLHFTGKDSNPWLLRLTQKHYEINCYLLT